MTLSQAEAEKLARQLKHVDPYALSSLGPEIGSLCDHIISGSMKREIENAAFKQADAEIAKWGVRAHVRLHAGEMTAQEMRSILAVVSAIRASVHRALITPAKTIDTEG